MSSFNIFNERFEPPPFFFLFFASSPCATGLPVKKAVKMFRVKRRKKRKRKRKKQFFARFPSFSRGHIVYRYYRYYRCHNPGIGEILRVREFDGRKRCKKRGKNWRLVASDGTISINRTNRGRNRDPWWRNRGYIYIYIQAYRWLLSNRNNRCLFAGINQWYEKWVESGHDLFVTRKSAAILGSNLI